MKRDITQFLAFVFVLLFAAQPLRGQQQFAILEGMIADAATGETMPFANVTIKNKKGELLTGGSANLDGEFKVDSIPIGVFDVSVSFVGYKTLVFENHELVAGKNGIVALLEEDTAQIVICCICCCYYVSELDEVDVFEETEQTILSIDNQELVEVGFRIFPNPANDFITLEFAQDVSSIQLVDFNGQILSETKAFAFQRDLLAVSTFPAGFYTLRFFFDGKWETEKIVITH